MTKGMLPSIVGLACATTFGFSLWFSYKAGCAGDLKTGSHGDTQLALHYDSAFGTSLVLGLVLGATAAILTSRSSRRAARAMAIGIVPVTIAMWLVGWQLETWGVQSCFPH